MTSNEENTRCANCGEIVTIFNKDITSSTSHFCTGLSITNADSTYPEFKNVKKPKKLKDNKFLMNKMKKKKR